MADGDVDMKRFQGCLIGDRYRLEEYLDEGGFGAVYRGELTAFGLEIREVAIKLGKRPLSDAEAREVFADAALLVKTSESAADPVLRERFVTVHDLGRCPPGSELEGHPYLVMEFVRGGSLAKCLEDDGAFPFKRMADHFEQILQGVAFMHQTVHEGRARRPVVHRDLKPGNVLVVRESGRPPVLKVSDFGLCVEVDNVLETVESGGDLCYLAPESFTHDICSTQTDVYALGLLGYELLTGRCPFRQVGTHLRGDDPAKRRELRRLHLNARREEDFPELWRHPELASRPAVSAVLRTALQVAPEARTYRDAGELWAAWKAALQAGTGGVDERPWATAARLGVEAEQALRVGESATADRLLASALELCEDRERVPDRLLPARVYYLKVQRLLAQGQTEEAGRLAAAAHRRRVCRSTLNALADYFRAVESSSEASLRSRAATHEDQE